MIEKKKLQNINRKSWHESKLFDNSKNLKNEKRNKFFWRTHKEHTVWITINNAMKFANWNAKKFYKFKINIFFKSANKLFFTEHFPVNGGFFFLWKTKNSSYKRKILKEKLQKTGWYLNSLHNRYYLIYLKYLGEHWINKS